MRWNAAFSIGLTAVVGLGLGTVTAARAASAESSTATGAATTTKVTARDFPSVASMGRLIPRAAGGSRELQLTGPLQTVSPDCLGIGGVTEHAVSQRLMLYTGRGGSDLIAHHGVVPVISVHLYATRAEAAAALGEASSSYRACFGLHSNDSLEVKVGRLAVPTIGRASVGFRSWNAAPHGVRSHNTTILVQRGRYVVESDLISSRAPRRALAVAVARLSVRALG
ncbi:hypothetical protein [Nocardioides sp.]|uniref:hypothetical protein n=1 Tax=Nocardioides sp. TaxID=35761 RepID=UPI00263862B6|nr:hypothetical protein [Nocardioides sp.]